MVLLYTIIPNIAFNEIDYCLYRIEHRKVLK
jgi:hypothetical protein